MHRINEADVDAEQRRSPKGDFELQRKHVSLAMGATNKRQIKPEFRVVQVEDVVYYAGEE